MTTIAPIGRKIQRFDDVYARIVYTCMILITHIKKNFSTKVLSRPKAMFAPRLTESSIMLYDVTLR